MVDAREYHERTNHHPHQLGGSSEAMDPARKPRPYKQYRDIDRIDLDTMRRIEQPTLSLVAERTADPRITPQNERSAPVDRRTLATLCYAASGITQSVRTEDGDVINFRAASCTGKLYHIELYLVITECSDLPAGLYHFDPHRMALDVLRRGDVRHIVADAVGEGDETWSTVANAPVTVIATSEWWRNAWKYTERTYRHAFWDAGTVLANLLAAAHSEDLPASVVTGFADAAIADGLGVDPEHEGPLALVPIGEGAPVPGTGPIDPISPAVVPASEDPIDYPLIPDAWYQSAFSDGDAAREWRSSLQSISDKSSDRNEVTEQLSLAPVDHETASARPFYSTIRRRGSCRDYETRGPSRRQVGTVLDRALRGIPGDWNGATATGLSMITPYLLVTGVKDVPDGTYRYHQSMSTLERLGPCDQSKKAKLALSQPWAGEAHVNVYLMAAVDKLVEQYGNRGYRLAQLEAGLTLGRLYLATYAHRELGGLGLTFFDDLVTKHLQPTAGSQSPMCLFAFGRAAR